MNKLLIILLMSVSTMVAAFNCRDILQDTDLSYIHWSLLQQCLTEVNSENLAANTSTNIWRLIKSSFNGIENIPWEAYKLLGYSLTAISLEDLRNITMERVEIVEVFGSIRSTNKIQGFSNDQKLLIAEKVRSEWIGKNPETYSEYDLISMGDIVCQINASDIKELHPDAFKNAAEWIGNIKICPQDRMRAFAKLAKHKEAFGEPTTWSKLDVSVIGNIINGLPRSDVALIEKDKLSSNKYYAEISKTENQIQMNRNDN